MKDGLTGRTFPAPHLVPIFCLGLAKAAALTPGKSRRAFGPNTEKGDSESVNSKYE